MGAAGPCSVGWVLNECVTSYDNAGAAVGQRMGRAGFGRVEDVALCFHRGAGVEGVGLGWRVDCVCDGGDSAEGV